jgi:hypothetical protein
MWADRVNSLEEVLGKQASKLILATYVRPPVNVPGGAKVFCEAVLMCDISVVQTQN